jgi:hypothetical protein
MQEQFDVSALFRKQVPAAFSITSKTSVLLKITVEIQQENPDCMTCEVR